MAKSEQLLNQLRWCFKLHGSIDPIESVKLPSVNYSSQIQDGDIQDDVPLLSCVHAPLCPCSYIRPAVISLLLYEAYANESSQICPFLALRPEFHSNLRVILSTPRYCQSATFGRLTFCVYTLLFTEFAFNVATPTARTPRPPRKPLPDKRGLHAEL